MVAGKDWLYALLRGTQPLVLSPEPAFVARTTEFSRTVVKQLLLFIFYLYKYIFTPDNLYNVDETGISIVHAKDIEVLVLGAKRQVGGLSL
jgi:hypothetical protein